MEHSELNSVALAVLYCTVLWKSQGGPEEKCF